MICSCIVFSLILPPFVRSIISNCDRRFHIENYPRDLPSGLWIKLTDGSVHVPELTAFITLWRNTPTSADRLKLLEDRRAMVKVVQEVC